MADLTAKELGAITDQLNFERMMTCKYRSAVQASQDSSLKQALDQYAAQHQQNYESLLQYLK